MLVNFFREKLKKTMLFMSPEMNRFLCWKLGRNGYVIGLEHFHINNVAFLFCDAFKFLIEGRWRLV